jgi:hypothetical protein
MYLWSLAHLLLLACVASGSEPDLEMRIVGAVVSCVSLGLAVAILRYLWRRARAARAYLREDLSPADLLDGFAKRFGGPDPGHDSCLVGCLGVCLALLLWVCGAFLLLAFGWDGPGGCGPLVVLLVAPPLVAWVLAAAYGRASEQVRGQVRHRAAEVWEAREQERKQREEAERDRRRREEAQRRERGKAEQERRQREEQERLGRLRHLPRRSGTCDLCNRPCAGAVVSNDAMMQAARDGFAAGLVMEGQARRLVALMRLRHDTEWLLADDAEQAAQFDWLVCDGCLPGLAPYLAAAQPEAPAPARPASESPGPRVSGSCDLCNRKCTGTVVGKTAMAQAARKGFAPEAARAMLAMVGEEPEGWRQAAISGPASQSDWLVCDQCMGELEPYL